MKIKYLDGSVKEFENGKSALDIYLNPTVLTKYDYKNRVVALKTLAFGVGCAIIFATVVFPTPLGP